VSRRVPNLKGVGSFGPFGGGVERGSGAGVSCVIVVGVMVLMMG